MREFGQRKQRIGRRGRQRCYRKRAAKVCPCGHTLIGIAGSIKNKKTDILSSAESFVQEFQQVVLNKFHRQIEELCLSQVQLFGIGTEAFFKGGQEFSFLAF